MTPWVRMAEGVRVEAEVSPGALDRVADAMYQWYRGGGQGFSQLEWLALSGLEREAAIIAHERYRGETIGLQALAIKDPARGEEGHRGLAERLEGMGNKRPPTAEQALETELGVAPAPAAPAGGKP